MNLRPQEKYGGVRSLMRGLAESGSLQSWQDRMPQDVHLERSGSVKMPEFDTVHAVFEARRYFDDRHRLTTLYLARVAGTRELVSEELSDHIRAELAKATVSTSVSEMVLRTDSMSMEEGSDDNPMEFIEDEGYRHTQAVEYRINGNGEILECQRSEEYDQNGEVSLRFAYSEPYRRGRLVIELAGKEPLSDAPRLDQFRKKKLKRELAVDIALLEYADNYRNDTELLALSKKEHEARIFAITSFITRQADPIESLQIALS